MPHAKTWKQFDESPLTHSAAHYLISIHELIALRGYARVTDVAKQLGITTGSASTTLKALRAKDLVREDENKFLSLSPKAKELAESVIAHREMLVYFFHKVIGVDAEQAEIDACKIEHLLSDETSDKMLSFTNRYLRQKGHS